MHCCVPALRVAKVANLDNRRATRGRVEQHVFKLEIAMHDPLAVAVGNTANQLLEVEARLILDKFACTANPFKELAAARIFHHLQNGWQRTQTTIEMSALYILLLQMIVMHTATGLSHRDGMQFTHTHTHTHTQMRAHVQLRDASA